MTKRINRSLKRVLSGVLASVMVLSMFPTMPIAAEESNQKYPYTMFASSDEEGAITIDAGNFCVNGSIATNGTIESSGNMNVNGTKIQYADEDMIYILSKLDQKYFLGNNVEEHADDYLYSDMNININTPINVQGNLTLEGNISLNTGIKALDDVMFDGEVMNSNNSVICSEKGDITIDSRNVNLNGLVYAPYGTVEIKAQNLNLNSVVIIAQKIKFNCSSVNANYNSSFAEFVGTISEEHSEDYDPDDTSFDNWKNLKDTDGDGLPDIVENEIGTNPELTDTDGGGLDDYYELLVTYTDPLNPDTDDNGIPDVDEDFDEDGLTNLQEYELGTDPWTYDSDDDGLSDGGEINTYGTDPLKKDTDDDGLEDGDEIYFVTDPLSHDSDGNGILDGDEKRLQTFIHRVENEDCAVTEVEVSMEGTDNLNNTTTIENIMNKDVLCSGVVGLVGEPFEIKTTSLFDKATLTFEVDKTKLGDTKFDDLKFLWYDEKNDNFVELDTIHDAENSKISVETMHFSKYMLVDFSVWLEKWETIQEMMVQEILQKQFSSTPKYDVYFYINVINTPNSADPIEYVNGELVCKRLDIFSELNKVIVPKQKTVLSYWANNPTFCSSLNYNAVLNALIKGSKSNLAPFHMSNLYYSFKQSSVIYNHDVSKSKPIIAIAILTEDFISYDSKQELPNDIRPYYLDLREGYDNNLEQLANKNGGEYLKYSEENIEYLKSLISETESSDVADYQDLLDTDGDGFPDIVETFGIPLSNGVLVQTSPNNVDTDGDGWHDNEEVVTEITKVEIYGKQGNESTIKYYHHFTSNPNQKYCFDSSTDATKHNLAFNDDGYYRCSCCAYEAMSPDCQDISILSEDDYLRVLCLRQEYVNSLMKDINEQSSTEDIGNHYFKSFYIAEIELIRQKDEYSKKYDFKGSDGKYYSLFYVHTDIDKLTHKYDENGKMKNTEKVISWTETVDKNNIINYQYSYVIVPAVFSIAGFCIGLVGDPIISTIGGISLNAITVRETSASDIAWSTFTSAVGVITKTPSIKIVLNIADVTEIIYDTKKNDLSPQYGDKHVYIQNYYNCHCGYRTCKQPLWTETTEYFFRNGELIYVSQ